MMDQDWADAFGSGLHLSISATNAVVGNGASNAILGDVVTQGSSTAGHVDPGIGAGGMSIAVDATTAVVGNGFGNVVGGDVVTDGHASAGGLTHFGGEIPFVGHLDIAVDTTTAVVGNGMGNFIGGEVFTAGAAEAADHAFLF